MLTDGRGAKVGEREDGKQRQAGRGGDEKEITRTKGKTAGDCAAQKVSTLMR